MYCVGVQNVHAVMHAVELSLTPVQSIIEAPSLLHLVIMIICNYSPSANCDDELRIKGDTFAPLRLALSSMSSGRIVFCA